MFDAKKFQKELIQQFLANHPEIKPDSDLMKSIVLISSEVSAMAIEKYIKESCN